MRRLLPPHLALIALAAMLALDWLLPLVQVVAPPLANAGYAIFLFGFGMVLGGGWQFRQVKTNIRPFRKPGILVTTGLFRLSRNPMYLGMALALAGVAIRLGSLSALLVPVAFVVIVSRRYIAFEEPMMRDTFGAAYEAYCRRVRRWI